MALAVVVLAAAFGQIRIIDPAAIERVALEELRATNTPGAEIAVISGDRVIFSHGYGVADVETGTPMTADLLCRLGSTTKMFTAAAVVGLALDGKVDLNAPVSRYVNGLDETIGKLTANQLLSHTSGLHDEAPMFGTHDEQALGTGIRAWKADFLFAPPGRIYSYSNPGYWLAGYLAETVAGKPYADVIESRLFAPLGMKRSTLRPTMAMTWPLAQGHEVRDGKPEVIRPASDNSGGWPAGSIFSSAMELSRFVIAFMNGGQLDSKQVLSPRLIEILSSPHADVPGSDQKYGYGLMLSNRRGVRWVDHGGSRAGYGSFIRMAPDRKFAVIALANRSGSGMPKLVEAVCEQMLSLSAKVSDPPVHALDGAQAKAYAGPYVNGSGSIRLDESGGKLSADVGERKVPITHAGDGFLLGEVNGDEPPMRIVLVPGANGRVEYLFAGGRAFRRTEVH